MADSLLLRAAIEYASLGLRVIPLHNVLPDGSCSCRRCDPASGRRGKHPRQMGWQRSASADPETIRSWWRSWPDANVGVATGRGLVVLDADGQEGRRTLLDLQRRHGRLPETALAVTGGGGLHYLFRTPAPVASATGANRAWPGLDVVGEGGLVVAAPSVHHCGGRYRWVRQPGEGVAAVPGWLLTQLRGAGRLKDQAHGGPSEPHPCDGMRPGGLRAAAPARTPPGATETPLDPQLVDGLLKEMVERFPVTQLGERNGQMYPAVASLVCRGCSDALTRAVMTAWLAHYRANMRAGPEEARRLLDAAVRCALDSPNLRPALSAADHEALCQGTLLTPLQRRFLHAEIAAGDSPGTDYRFRRPSGGRWFSLFLACHPPLLVSDEGGAGGKESTRRLCESVQERAFVEALIVHCMHKVLDTQEEVIRATNDQLRAILRQRHGLELHPQQFGRLKQKFVTRPDKPATRFELMRQMVEGRRTAQGGVPSEYELTGLGWLFSREGGPGRSGSAATRAGWSGTYRRRRERAASDSR